MTWTGIYRHTNGTDTLYAMPLATGAFTAVGIVIGNDDDQASLYVFASLDEAKTYEIRIRSGANPAASDLAIATLGNLPSATQISDRIERAGGPLDAIADRLDTEAIASGNVVSSNQGEITVADASDVQVGDVVTITGESDMTVTAISGNALTLSDAAYDAGGPVAFAITRLVIRSQTGASSGGGFTADDRGNLVAIKAKTDTIGAGTVQSVSPVAAGGEINGPIVIGDDYLAANGRAFEWIVDPVTGFNVADVSARFGIRNQYSGAVEVVGTVSSATGGKWKLSFDLPNSETSKLSCARYDWSADVIDSQSESQITKVRNASNTYQVVAEEKQTGRSD